ncbi:hypothetical protein [Oceanicoccus sp. KOV_DT_Chl]|uniref:hypothetical protein n=1 Tax=Oceanicoccus sp. KOV_DT_Chl TaxID=1904639 RepID=UPI0011AFAE34|nr:hypothetical protein [Oceanicoccus sp. KOV_DT_Chl]
MHDSTGRILVSWSPCRVIDDADAQVYIPCNIGAVDAEPAPPLYGIWMNNPNDGTQLPVVLAEEGFMFTDIVAGEPATSLIWLPTSMRSIANSPLTAAASC